MFQGYLLLRGLHQREDVLEARKGTKKVSECDDLRFEQPKEIKAILSMA